MTTKRRRTRTEITPKHASLHFLHFLPFLLVFSLALIPTTNSSAQAREHPKDYALIIGTVWGPDDRPLPGVTVKIRRAADKRARWEVSSDRRGEFEQRLPVGKQDYVIWADISNYKPLKGLHLQPSPQVTVHIQNNERADTGLHLK
jgi:hypothetical protein